MKTANLVLGLAAAALPAMIFTGCHKPDPPKPPTPDTEFQSSVDASYALFTATDAEMIASFMGESYARPSVYEVLPGSNPDMIPTNSPEADVISLSYNNNNCVDGHLRNGTIRVERSVDPNYNPNANDNSHYYRRYGYAGRMKLLSYTLDGWHVETTNADHSAEGECVSTNLLTADNSGKKSPVNLSWHIVGNFKLTKGDQTITCDIDVIKTLVNTADNAVAPSSPLLPIDWTKATVAYTGKASGSINGVPYSMSVDEKRPVVRDFTCSPDKVSNVTPGGNSMVIPQYSEFHPFRDGVAYLTTDHLYPREIYYGGSQAAGEGQCDNSGMIRIKGIEYPVDFKK